MEYKHGIYGELVPSQEQVNSTGSGTIPVYIGTAPVHRLADYSKAVNNPMLITSLADAKTKLGYSSSDNFNDFTLSAVIFAHFENRLQPIGPIVVINVLNPATHKTAGTSSVALTNGVGYINDNVNLSSVSITGEIKGTDYIAEYIDDGRLRITSINEGLTSPVTVAFDKADLTKVQDSDLIGIYDPATGLRTGLECVDIIYEKLKVVPTVLSAPGWNHKKTIETALVNSCSKIGDIWEAILVTDLDCSTSKTIDAALTWKSTNNYKNIREKTCWPKAKVGTKVLWMSIIAIVRMQQTDFENDNVPYESPSNKQIDIDSLVLGDGLEITLNLTQANKLNEKGITTSLYFGGRWVLWGPHMSNYEYAVTTKPEEMFDVNIRTNLYLINDFNVRNSQSVDSPIQRNDIDYILSTEQLRLNSLISEGKLLYGTIGFNSVNNPMDDLANGNFVFDTKVTNTPPGKSITNKIQYSSQGLNTLTGGDV
jgi:uncharacterized protein